MQIRHSTSEQLSIGATNYRYDQPLAIDSASHRQRLTLESPRPRRIITLIFIQRTYFTVKGLIPLAASDPGALRPIPAPCQLLKAHPDQHQVSLNWASNVKIYLTDPMHHDLLLLAAHIWW